jgi:hypothetical protein
VGRLGPIGTGQRCIQAGPDGPATSIVSTDWLRAVKARRPTCRTPRLRRPGLLWRSMFTVNWRHRCNAVTRNVDMSVDVHAGGPAAQIARVSSASSRCRRLPVAHMVALDEGMKRHFGDKATPAEADDGQVTPGDELVGEGP